MSNSGSPDKKRKSANEAVENVDETAAKRAKTGDNTEQRKESGQKVVAPKKIVPDEDSEDFYDKLSPSQFSEQSNEDSNILNTSSINTIQC